MSGVRRTGSKGAGGGSAASTKEDGGHYPSMMDNMFEAACKFATFTSSRNENFRHTFLDHNAPESARAAQLRSPKAGYALSCTLDALAYGSGLDGEEKV